MSAPLHAAPAEASGPGETRRLVRQSGTTGVAAFGSVAAGLLLSVSIAASFGAGRRLDAFFVGANIPIGLVAMVMTAANQTLVPKFSTWFVQRSEDEAMASITRVFTAVVLAGVALACLGAALARPLAEVTAPGLSSSSITLAASVARIMFFVVPLTAAAEVLRGLLNSRYAFVAPAAMNIVMNVVAASIVLVLAGTDVHVVAWAYVAGAAGQLAFMAVLARRHGFRVSAGSPFRDPEVMAVARLSRLPLLAACLNPLVRIGEQLFASYLPTGSISIVNYGMTLVNAIGGAVFFRSVIVALLPRLTEATARDQRKRVADTASLGLKVMLGIALPLTAFMAVLAKPAVRAVFARGSFNKASASLLGLMLAVYAASLVGSAVQRALLAPFFAKLDTRTPLVNTMYGAVTNLVLLPICVLPWGRGHANAVLGVAIAYSASQYVNVAHAAYRLRRYLGEPLAVPVQWTLRVALPSATAAAAMYGASVAIGLNQDTSRVLLLVKTVAVGLGGLVVIGTGIAALGAGEARRMLGELRRNRKGGSRRPGSAAPARSTKGSADLVPPAAADLAAPAPDVVTTTPDRVAHAAELVPFAAAVVAAPTELVPAAADLVLLVPAAIVPSDVDTMPPSARLSGPCAPDIAAAVETASSAAAVGLPSDEPGRPSAAGLRAPADIVPAAADLGGRPSADVLLPFADLGGLAPSDGVPAAADLGGLPSADVVLPFADSGASRVLTGYRHSPK